MATLGYLSARNKDKNQDNGDNLMKASYHKTNFKNNLLVTFII